MTPTGAALLRAIDPVFGPPQAMRVERIRSGAGTRNWKDFPNVLRLSVGESSDAVPSHSANCDTVTVMETALDDLSPQVLALCRRDRVGARRAGRDADPGDHEEGTTRQADHRAVQSTDSAALERLILTGTLGVRMRQERRSCLERKHIPVATKDGEIRIKIGSLDGVTMNAAPSGPRAAAAKHRVAIKQVQQAAIAAYLRPATAKEGGAA